MKKPKQEKTAETRHAGFSKQFAIIISEVTNPLFIAIPTFLVIALSSTPHFVQALLWWFITVLGISAAPFFFILRGVRRGHYSDHHVSIREQRFVPLSFGLGCFLLALLLLSVLQASAHLLATVVAATIALAVATVITQYWKISLHLVGMAGAVTTFTLVFGAPFLLLSPLVVLVAWARWKVGAHTPLQALAGSALAVSVTLVIFWLFGLM